MNINFQKELDKVIDRIKKECIECDGNKPKLLLHACCAPCSSYCIEYLEPYFDITLYFFNPNISSIEEYNKRANELKRLVNEMGLEKSVKVVIENYEPELYNRKVEGLEKEPERGARCTKCFDMRLLKTAMHAKEYEYNYYSTTLTISPHKNAALINELGNTIGKQQDIEWLYTDFKKKNGYKRSIELSAEYNLYRQDFCGCVHSKRQREENKFNDKLKLEKENGK